MLLQHVFILGSNRRTEEKVTPAASFMTVADAATRVTIQGSYTSMNSTAVEFVNFQVWKNKENGN